MKYLLITVLVICSCLTYGQTSAVQPFSFVAIGDMPYFLPDDYARFENLISKLNQENYAFTIHVGDIKSGSTVCSDEYFTRMFGYFQTFSKPLIYTPGDNEWTDCNRKEAGAFDPHERLQKIRSVFFADRNSFGKQKIALTSQASNPAYTKFVENNRWEHNGVLFATVHAVGTNNNRVPEDDSRLKEFEERNKANLAWLDETFKMAKETNRAAVVISMQADMFVAPKTPNGFEDLIAKLTSLSIDFGKPVLLINGDSHRFLIDKPLVMAPDPKINKSRVVTNFTRLQLFGEQDMHAVKITINPNLPGLFQIDQLFIKGN